MFCNKYRNEMAEGAGFWQVAALRFLGHKLLIRTAPILQAARGYYLKSNDKK